MKGDLFVPFVVGVTGHKTVENTVQVKEDLRSFFQALNTSLSKDTPVVMISALAAGADRLFVNVGLSVLKTESRGRRVSLVYVEAYHGFEDEPEQDDEFRRLKGLVDRVVHANGDCDDGASAFVGKTPLRKKANGGIYKYFAAGEYIRMNSNVVVAIWDGRIEYDKIGNGGTGDVVNYCLHPECYRNDDYLHPIMSVPIWFIPGKRSATKGEVALNFEDAPSAGLLNNMDGIKFDASWKGVDGIIGSLNSLNKELGRTEGGDADLWQRRRLASARVSDSYKSRYRKIFGIVFFLAVLAGFFAQIFGGIDFVYFERILVGRTYGTPGAVLGAGVLTTYLVMFAVSFAFYSFDRGDHVSFGDFRSIAEVLRVKRIWAICGLNESILPYVGMKLKLEQETGINVIRNWELEEVPYVHGEDELRKIVQQDVVNGWIRNQWQYFSARDRECRRWDALYCWCGRFAFLISLCFAGHFCIAIWQKIYVSEGVLQSISMWCAYGLLVGIGPFLMSCTSYIRSKRRWGQLASNYKLMRDVFSRAYCQLTGNMPSAANKPDILPTITAEGIRRIVRNLGIAALDEGRSWAGGIYNIRPTPTI